MMNGDTITDQPLKTDDDNRSTSYGSLGYKSLPSSLQQLYSAKEVTVRQLIDPVEVVVGCCARPCRYSVCADSSEEQFLYVEEVSDCYARQIMGAARGFRLKFTDNEMIKVIQVVRPQTCSRGCCGCCCCCSTPSLEIQTPPGTAIATITERRTCLYPTYDIISNDNQMQFTMATRCWYPGICNLCSDVHIDIISAGDDQPSAQILKYTKMNGYEYLGQRNDFTIKYTAGLPIHQRVAILGSLFLIDYHNFERQNRCCC